MTGREACELITELTRLATRLERERDEARRAHNAFRDAMGGDDGGRRAAIQSADETRARWERGQ